MFKLPELNYSFNDLEPHIDAQTMEIHYTKHHQAYADKFNEVLGKYPELTAWPLEKIFRELKTLPVEETDRQLIRNFGGGYINHNIFWENLSAKKQINEGLQTEIIQSFGSMEEFKEKFITVAKSQFGSGWAWLVRDENQELKVYSLPNQDTPYEIGHEPIFNLDVWEHAYYLKYQNKRPDYIQAWWNVLKVL